MNFFPIFLRNTLPIAPNQPLEQISMLISFVLFHPYDHCSLVTFYDKQTNINLGKKDSFYLSRAAISETYVLQRIPYWCGNSVTLVGVTFQTGVPRPSKVIPLSARLIKLDNTTSAGLSPPLPKVKLILNLNNACRLALYRHPFQFFVFALRTRGLVFRRTRPSVAVIILTRREAIPITVCVF